ncbi:MAG: uracil phosphoribosyltransferase [Armatimonadetes bacterium]|nr:uracil phosphoribosyltransferase [Armatimonadota bacterium]
MPLHVVDHPLIQHKMSILRHKDTGPKEFRELVEEIAMLMAYEATRNFPLEPVDVETPLETTRMRAFLGKKVAVIPILRAGLGMVNGILQLIPAAKVGHVGIYRDHDTLKPVDYYSKFPEDLAERDVLLLDPMLATGGSASAAIEFLKSKGARSEAIKFVCLVAAPEGVRRIDETDNVVDIYTAALDRCLNSFGYIMPGLGDAGDRMFGTR